MAVSLQFVLERVRISASAHITLGSKWLWAGWSVPKWEAQLSAFQARTVERVDAQTALDVATGRLDVALDELHDRTVKWLTFLKVLHRRDQVNRNLLKPLTARGDSRKGIFEEATGLAATWHSINPAWSPEVGETLSTFETYIQQCRTLQETFVLEKTELQMAADALNCMANDLHDDCVGWYELATVMFSAKTPEGRMIRGTVPTTYQRAKPDEQPELELGEVATVAAKSPASPTIAQPQATTPSAKNFVPLESPPASLGNKNKTEGHW